MCVLSGVRKHVDKLSEHQNYAICDFCIWYSAETLAGSVSEPCLTAMAASSLAEATSVQAIDSNSYSVNFCDEWCIGAGEMLYHALGISSLLSSPIFAVPHGGYVTSCILSATSNHFGTTLFAQNQPHTITLYLTFLRRTSIGRATIRIEHFKIGRRTSTIHVSLFSGPPNSPPCVVGYLTQSNLHTESGISLQTQNKLLPPIAPLVSTAALRANTDPNWTLLHPKPFASFRKAHQHTRIYVPKKEVTPALVDEWMCFQKEGERFTNESLGYVVDAFEQIVERYSPEDVEKAMGKEHSPKDFPSSIMSQNEAHGNKLDRSKWARFWYPTVLIHLEIKKALPPEGAEWLFVRTWSNVIKNGRTDLNIVVMDEGGDVVALSQHVALVLGAERNMVRKKGSAGKNKL